MYQRIITGKKNNQEKKKLEEGNKKMKLDVRKEIKKKTEVFKH